jgi:hypothetical protein
MICRVFTTFLVHIDHHSKTHNLSEIQSQPSQDKEKKTTKWYANTLVAGLNLSMGHNNSFLTIRLPTFYLNINMQKNTDLCQQRQSRLNLKKVTVPGV